MVEKILSNLEKTESETKDVNLSSFVNYKNLKKPFIMFLLSVFFIMLSFTVFSNSLFSSLDRLMNYRYSLTQLEKRPTRVGGTCARGCPREKNNYAVYA